MTIKRLAAAAFCPNQAFYHPSHVCGLHRLSNALIMRAYKMDLLSPTVLAFHTMKLLIATPFFFAVLATVLALPASHLKCVPKNMVFDRPDDLPYDSDSSCGMCLDLVEVLQIHEDCHRRMVEKKMDEKCNSYGHTGVLDQICRIFVESMHEEVSKHVDREPMRLCSKLLDCQYE
uniref:Saposin B-type domain-containing protein n=1 Tax=Steinernema glaseri TaxID=37863 RepID=A0A1I7ZUY3_9BILA